MSSITIIVPALNEEGNLAQTVQDVVPLLGKEFSDYEILIFDDGSSDKTGSIGDTLASQNNRIKVIHNPQTMGLGYNYKKGVELSAKDYILMIPGDNEITLDSFETMFKRLGKSDMIIPHTVNMEIRPWGRQILSRTYTRLINLFFGLNLKYFNGPVIHKRSIIQPMGIKTDSFAYQTEILVQLIKAGHTFEETGMYLKERQFGKSKALKLKNVWRVLKSVASLFYKVRIK